MKVYIVSKAVIDFKDLDFIDTVIVAVFDSEAKANEYCCTHQQSDGEGSSEHYTLYAISEQTVR